MPDLLPRQQHLLNAIHSSGGRWNTRRVNDLYRGLGINQASTARRDLQTFVRLGHLAAHGPDDGRYYLAPTKGGTA